MLYIKLFTEREKNIGQSAPECPFKQMPRYRIERVVVYVNCWQFLHTLLNKYILFKQSARSGCVISPFELLSAM